MNEPRDATFDGEVLRLDEPLGLPPETRVRVTIEAATVGDRPDRPGGRSPGLRPDWKRIFEVIPQFVLEEDDEPIDSARRRAQMERMQLNGDWLQAHWDDLIPQARGNYVAVAGQEGFIAATADEAWAWTRSAHPEDDGALVQFVLNRKGPRIYGHRG